ncbi:hypothetical protein C2U70_03040 [Bradyrhizobium guangdongense]|nr:hypothetical protein C2U70_03040 [Bradyrhizobium guangdongense]
MVAAVSAAALVGWFTFAFHDYSYRYRLTVNIEIDGKVHTGSSVIDVTWHEGIKIGDGSPFGPLLRGQAPIVDLDDHGIVIATLIANYKNSKDGQGALWLVPRAFGDAQGVNLAMLPSLQGKRELALDNLPRFLWFANSQEPTTGRGITVADFASVLGPSAHFVSASVEITNDPVVISIREKLPWIAAIEKRPPGEQVLYLPNGLGISRYMFIGGAS